MFDVEVQSQDGPVVAIVGGGASGMKGFMPVIWIAPGLGAVEP
ncbi:hypothetical protein ABGB12_30675 [Actinocorallia sp. B10E7]